MRRALRNTGLLLLLSIAAGSAAFATSAGAVPILDTAFGGGVITPKVFPNGKWRQVARGAVVQPDGKIVVAMSLSANYGRRSKRPLLRYNTDGTLDGSFGKGGVAWFRIPGINFFGLEGITQLRDGSFLVRSLGSRTEKSRTVWTITRVKSTGRVDRSFGKAGSVTLFPRDYFRPLLGVEVADDGSIIAAFRRDRGFTSVVDLVRLHASGKIDRGFADHGIRTIKLAGDQSFPTLTDFKLAGDKAYLLALANFDGPGVPCKVIRVALDRDGRPDRSFGKDGSVTLGAGARGRKGLSMACAELSPTKDGGVAVATTTYDESVFDLSPIGVVFKLQGDGSRDPSFGIGGRSNVGSDGADGIAQLPDGTFLVTGDRSNEDHDRIGGTAVALDSRGVPATFLPGGLVPGTERCFGGGITHSAAGNVTIFTKWGTDREVGTRIAKFTN